MFEIMVMTSKIVIIGFDAEIRLFSVHCFERAKGREGRSAVVRNAVEIMVEGKRFIFSQREWEAGRRSAWLESCRRIPQLIRTEIQEKVKNSKRLAKQRDARIRMDAERVVRRNNQ